MFHLPGGVRAGEVPYLVQGRADHGGRAGADGCGGQGRGEEGVACGYVFAGDPCLREHAGGQGEPSPGFADADPQPGTQEFGGVPVTVIDRADCIDRAGRRGEAGRGNRRRGVRAGCRSCFGCAGGCGFWCCWGGLGPAGPPSRRRGWLACRLGFEAGPFHGLGRDDLQELHRPRDLLDLAGEIRGIRESERAGIREGG